MRQLRSDESNHEDEINARHFPNPCSWVELAENMARERVPGMAIQDNVAGQARRYCLSVQDPGVTY